MRGLFSFVYKEMDAILFYDKEISLKLSPVLASLVAIKVNSSGALFS